MSIELFGRLLALKKAGYIEHVDYIRNILRSDDVRRNTVEDFHIILPRQNMKLTRPGIDDILMKIDKVQFEWILVSVSAMNDDDIYDVYEYAIDSFLERDKSSPGNIEKLAIPFSGEALPKSSEIGRLLEFIKQGAVGVSD